MAPRNNQPTDGISRTAANEVLEGLGVDSSELDNDAFGADDGGAGDGDDGLDDDQGSAFVGRGQGEDGDGDDLDSPSPFDFREGDDPSGLGRLSQTRQRQQQPQPKPRGQPDVRRDKQGNIIDTKTGRVIARGGAQVRFYNQAQKARRELDQSRSDLTALQGKFRELGQIARQLHDQVRQNQAVERKFKDLGLSAEDQLNAMQMFVDLKTNPAQHIRRLLTRAATNGITIEGLQNNGGLDAKALGDLIKDEVGKLVNPLRERSDADEQRRTNEDKQRQLRESINEEVNTFFVRNPEAKRFLPVFMRLMGDPQYNQMSLREMWAEIRLHRALNPRRGEGRGQRTLNSRSIPNGRGSAPGGNSRVANPNESYDSIISGVLDEAGIGQPRV